MLQAAMNQPFKSWLEANNIDFKKDCTLERSKKTNYEGSSILIAWISCPKFEEILGQDYLVLSKTLCDNVLEQKTTKLSSATITITDDGMGLIMPKDVTVLDTTDLW